MISKAKLLDLYEKQKLSSAEIAKRHACSQGKVNYWLEKYHIPKRSISNAIYAKWNPDGDPFLFSEPTTLQSAFLYGMGLGLYWGEGTKKAHSVRLGNSDPNLIKSFIEFLEKIYKIDSKRLRFGLQIFGDMNKDTVVQFWTKKLNISERQFYKPIVTPYRGIGTYRQKSKHGVLTVYFNNRKLRDILCSSIENLSMSKPM